MKQSKTDMGSSFFWLYFDLASLLRLPFFSFNVSSLRYLHSLVYLQPTTPHHSVHDASPSHPRLFGAFPEGVGLICTYPPGWDSLVTHSPSRRSIASASVSTVSSPRPMSAGKAARCYLHGETSSTKKQ